MAAASAAEKQQLLLLLLLLLLLEQLLLYTKLCNVSFRRLVGFLHELGGRDARLELDRLVGSMIISDELYCTVRASRKIKMSGCSLPTCRQWLSGHSTSSQHRTLVSQTQWTPRR
jgi:hypothetical protein